MKLLFLTIIPIPFTVELMKFTAKKLGAELVLVFEKKSLKGREHWNIEYEGNYLGDNPVKEFSEILDREKPELIFCSNYRSPLTKYSAKWSKKNNSYFFIGPHELLTSDKAKVDKKITDNFLYKNVTHKIREKIYTKIANQSNGVIVMGKKAKRDIAKIYDGFILNVPYCFDMTHLFKMEPPKDKIIFLYSGQLRWFRNPILCLKAFKKIKEIYPNKEIEFVISGKGPLLEECESFIAENNLSDSVTWMNDFKDWYDIHNIYSHANVLLALQQFGNWGLIIQEAMAAGMALISTSTIQSADNLIVHGYNGYITSEQIDEVVNHMRTYIENPDSIQLHGKRNKEIARTVDVDHCSNELLNFINIVSKR